MKMTTSLVIGLCGSLVLTSALAPKASENEEGNAGTEVASEQEGERGKTADGNAVSGTSAAKGNRKPAGTGTAAGYINKQVQEGNMKIEGVTTETEIVLP